MIRVLFVLFLNGMGGAERLVHSLVSKLDRSRFVPSVAWFGNDEPLSEFVQLGIPLYHVPKASGWRGLMAMGELSRIATENEIDVVVAQHFMPAVFSYYACRRRKNRALIFVAHSEWEIIGIPRIWKAIGAVLLNRIEASVGVSEQVAEVVRCELGVQSKRVRVIENGVDTRVFCPNRNASQLRAELGIGTQEHVIGIVANLKVVKNHLLLLQAFELLRRRGEAVRLLIVGAGFSEEEDNTESMLRAYVRRVGLERDVLFLGRRGDIPKLLNAMDVFCLTSKKEGLPIGLIEAMASGLPVIGTNVEGIRDVIVSEENGLLVDLGDTEALAGAIGRLCRMASERKRFGEAARETVQKLFSLDACVSKYEGLLTEARAFLNERWR